MTTVSSLGDSLDGTPLHLLQIGTAGPEKRALWITSRQHPSESMAEWCVEGLVERLLSQEGRADPDVAACIAGAVFYVVPNANPDGSRRGHSRTNAAGANLN